MTARQALGPIQPARHDPTAGIPHPATAPANGAGDESATDRLRAKLVRGLPAIRSIAGRSPLVGGLLDLDSFAVLYGRPGGGKSFLAIDLALHIATGSWWHGHRIKPGAVLYLVAEGSGGIAARVHAWAVHNRYQGSAPDFVVLPTAVNLLDVVEAHALANIAAEIHPAFVVIDTLNRSMVGGDENGSKDMGLVIAAADKIRAATGACVLVVHHSGKDTSAGSRGHSSLLGAVDTELELKNAGDGILNLTSTKQKDRPDGGLPLRFTLVPHAWPCPTCGGRPADADDCDTCENGTISSAAIGAYTGRADTADGIGDKARQALEALRSIDVDGGVTAGQWQKVAHSNHGIPESSFYLHRKTLLAAGMVQQHGTDGRPRYTALTSTNT